MASDGPFAAGASETGMFPQSLQGGIHGVPCGEGSVAGQPTVSKGTWLFKNNYPERLIKSIFVAGARLLQTEGV